MLEIIKSQVALLKDRRGVTAVEYAVIAGVLVAVIGLGFTALGSNLQSYLGGLSFHS